MLSSSHPTCLVLPGDLGQLALQSSCQSNMISTSFNSRDHSIHPQHRKVDEQTSFAWIWPWHICHIHFIYVIYDIIFHDVRKFHIRHLQTSGGSRTHLFVLLNTIRPGQNGCHFADDIFYMKMYEFRLQCLWSLFLGVQSVIFQHWVRLWLR